MKWFRLWTDIIDDPKLRGLEDGDFRRLICLFAMASEEDKDGLITASAGDIAWRIRCRKDHLEITLKKLESLNILKRNENQIEFVHWKKRQYKSDSSVERTRKWREKRDCDVTVTSPKRHGDALDTDTDTDTDKPPYSPPVGDVQPQAEKIPFTEIVQHLNEKTGSQFRASTTKTKTLIRARWAEGFRLDDFKTVIDNMVREWFGDQKMNIYLRPETLFSPKFEGYLQRKPKPNVEDGTPPF